MYTSKKILLASVLKPIDDTRMYEKFAITLADYHEVTVCGAESISNDIEQRKGITFHDHPIRNRDGRIYAILSILKVYLKVKPDIVVIHCPELLLPALIMKCIRPSISVIYDVQENYWSNILYQNFYQKWTRYLLALFIRIIEFISWIYVDKFILAEQTYAHETLFHKGKSIILENKYADLWDIRRNQSNSPYIELLYCGTISRVFGVWQAIRLVKDLRVHIPNIRLSIMGYCVDKVLSKEIQSFVAQEDWILIDDISTLVPHKQILEAMSQAHYVLLPYPNNPSTIDCIPTKLYECLALGIPIIVQENPLWKRIATISRTTCHFIDFEHPDVHILAEVLCKPSISIPCTCKTVLWDKEKTALLSLFGQLT